MPPNTVRTVEVIVPELIVEELIVGGDTTTLAPTNLPSGIVLIVAPAAATVPVLVALLSTEPGKNDTLLDGVDTVVTVLVVVVVVLLICGPCGLGLAELERELPVPLPILSNNDIVSSKSSSCLSVMLAVDSCMRSRWR